VYNFGGLTLVIAKPEWFKKRNRKGFWSYELPWQGTLYMICTLSLIFVGMLLPQNLLNSVLITVLFLFLFMDGIIANVKSLDEREQMQYSISMRNTVWGMIIALAVLLVLSSSFNIDQLDLYRSIFVAVFAGGIIGIITRYKLHRDG
jgi:uncharacterized membrane protein HdeD (DUF308 family)